MNWSEGKSTWLGDKRDIHVPWGNANPSGHKRINVYVMVLTKSHRCGLREPFLSHENLIFA